MADGRKSYAQKLVEERTGREIGEYLRDLYVTRRLTDQEISDLLDLPRATVAAWRNELGITRADRTVPTELTA